MRPIALLVAALLLLSPLARAGTPDDLRAKAMERVRAGLNDPDRGVRFAAVEALGKAKEPTPDALVAMLADPEWCVRREAAWWLRRGGEPALAQLAKVLATGEWPAREAATWALSSFGEAAVPLLRTALADGDEEVRLEAIAAAGRLDKDVAASLVPLIRPFAEKTRSDEENAEAAAALAILDPKPPEAPAKKPDSESHPVPPSRPSSGSSPVTPPPDPALVPSKDLDPYFEPIERTLALAKGAADSDALGKALADPERDVRLAAVIALDRASGDPTPRLVAALRDPNARVVRLAIRALGRRGAAGAQIAPFLTDPALATSEAAREALETIGAEAALPTVAAMETGHYGALHQGRLIFERLGAAGAPATARLAALLAHDDVNVREAAARCLFTIGPAARTAAPALAKALHDPRLCVVANAALALGRVGLSEEAIAATSDASARVRAYATFALGWALGDLVGVDQAAYERRLPVLDIGATGPFPTAAEVDKTASGDESNPSSKSARDAVLRLAIRSKDPKVAIPAAALLDENSVDVTEAERVMELLLPEGIRQGSPVDFERLRSLIGSSELMSCVEYAALARRTSADRESIYGNFHRITRADNLLAVAWFDRNEEPAVTRDDGDLWYPDDRTVRYAPEQVSKYVPAASRPSVEEATRRALEEFRKDPEYGLDAPRVWLLRDFVPKAEDGPLLLACASVAETTKEPDPAREDATHWALVRLLGFLSDDASLAYLKTLAAEESTSGLVAKAALVRRGDASALKALVAASRDDDEAMAVLMEVAPLVANRALVARILGDEYPIAAAGMGTELLEAAHRLGVVVPPEAFLGVERVLAERSASDEVLVTILLQLPGCSTRRMGARLFDVYEKDATSNVPADRDVWLRDDDEGFRVASALLLAAEPEAGLARLRRLAASPRAWIRPAAALVLLRVQDVASVTPIVAALRVTDRNYLNLDVVTRFHRPEIGALLLEWANQPDLTQETEDAYLHVLARFHGWPSESLNLNEDVTSPTAAREAIRRGDLTMLRSLLKADPAGAEPVWTRIGRAALAGDKQARAEFWSACRAGRYRWIQGDFDAEIHSLGRDPSVLPHWAFDLDSNCCRISDGMADGIFEDAYGVPHIYDLFRYGVGRPASEFVRDWMGLHASRFVWSPLLGRFIPEPE